MKNIYSATDNLLIHISKLSYESQNIHDQGTDRPVGKAGREPKLRMHKFSAKNMPFWMLASKKDGKSYEFLLHVYSIVLAITTCLDNNHYLGFCS